MEILRTPDDRFLNLPGYPFKPHYLEADGQRIHYVDEGPPSAAPVLMLHGEPSWSYLYRKMIPVFVSAGLRAVAPDLVGFGRSDKPANREDYTYQGHVNWTARFIQKLDLRGINPGVPGLGRSDRTARRSRASRAICAHRRGEYRTADR
jgi:haloalkane dehalogenase